jgi:hypothetical protein
MNVEGADLFDVDTFLAQPLIARVAAAGPSVRPVWYLWEEDQLVADRLVCQATPASCPAAPSLPGD